MVSKNPILRDQKSHKKSMCYSIMKKTWIQEPEKVQGEVEEKEIEKKVNNFKTKIDAFIKNENVDGLRELVKKLRDSRSVSLQKYGEYGFENMVFKELRNQGYIDKVRTVVVNLKSKSLSL